MTGARKVNTEGGRNKYDVEQISRNHFLFPFLKSYVLHTCMCAHTQMWKSAGCVWSVLSFHILGS